MYLLLSRRWNCKGCTWFISFALFSFFRKLGSNFRMFWKCASECWTFYVDIRSHRPSTSHRLWRDWRSQQAAWHHVRLLLGLLSLLWVFFLPLPVLLVLSFLGIIPYPWIFRGYNIGARLVDDFLAKANITKCTDFRETADVIAKVHWALFDESLLHGYDPSLFSCREVLSAMSSWGCTSCSDYSSSVC